MYVSLVVGLAECGLPGAPEPPAAWRRDLEELYAVCVQEALPNSMARGEGVDMDAVLAELRRERDGVEPRFSAPVARTWLEDERRRIATDPDLVIERWCLDGTLARLAVAAP